MTHNRKTLRENLNIWIPEELNTKNSFDFSPLTNKSPILLRQKTIIESPLKRATTLKSFFDKESKQISQFLNFNTQNNFNQQYPIKKVLYINNFTKKPKTNTILTNKFIFQMRRKNNRYTADDRLKSELNELFLKEIYQKKQEKILSFMNNITNSPIPKKIEKCKKLSVNENVMKIFRENNKKDYFNHVYYNGKKIFKPNLQDEKVQHLQSSPFQENQYREKKIKRPLSAASCLYSTNRQIKFVDNLLSQKALKKS